MAAFKGRRWQEALEGFEQALAIAPDDKPSSTYAGRCRAFLEQPPPPDWEGIFELLSK